MPLPELFKGGLVQLIRLFPACLVVCTVEHRTGIIVCHISGKGVGGTRSDASPVVCLLFPACRKLVARLCKVAYDETEGIVGRRAGCTQLRRVAEQRALYVVYNGQPSIAFEQAEIAGGAEEARLTVDKLLLCLVQCLALSRTDDDIRTLAHLLPGAFIDAIEKVAVDV